MKKSTRIFARILLLLFASFAASQTVAVSADLKGITGAVSASDLARVSVCFSLVSGDNTTPPDPHVSGSFIVVPPRNKCFTSADGSINTGTGHFSANIVANDQITVSGVAGGTLWVVTINYQGRQVWGATYSFLLSDVTENLNTKTPANVAPFVSATPTDAVYMRVDGGNAPASAWTFAGLTDTGSLTVTGASVLASVTASGGLSIGKLKRDCRADGLAGDGATDDSAALNACIVNAVATNQGIIDLPCVPILLTANGWNITNIKTGEAGLIIKGCGGSNRTSNVPGTYVQGTTMLMCNTGTTKPCVDMIGSSNIVLQDLELNSSLISGVTTPSGALIIMGRDNATNSLGTGANNPFCYSQWNGFYNLQMYTAHSGVVNSNFGYLGIYNIGSEIWTMNNSHIWADTPVWFGDTASVLGIGSQYQTIQAGCPNSATVATFTNNGFELTSSTGVGFEFRNVRSINIINQGMGSGVGITAFPIVFGDSGTDSDIHITGQFESANAPGAFIATNANLDRLDIKATVNGITGSSAGYIQFGANNLTISNSDIKINCTNGTCQPLISNINTGIVVRGSTLDLSTTLNPASFSSMSLIGDIIRADGFTDAQITIPASALGVTLYDNTGVSIHSSAGLPMAGSTSGAITLLPTAVAGSNTLTLPAATDTLAVLGTFAAPPAIGGTTPAAGTFTTLSATGAITKVNNFTTAGPGVAAIAIPPVHSTGNNNNIGSTNLIASVTAGRYRVHGYWIETTAAGVSSTLPNLVIGWTDADSSVAQTFTAAATNAAGNSTAGVYGFLTFILNCKSATALTYQTTGYASNAANAMQYALNITVEYLGP